MQTKQVQGSLWSTAPANWARLMEPAFIPMYEAVLAQVKLDEQKMLLDAGCGSGLFLSMASATGASLHGIDAAPGLLEISRERLPGITLLVEDLERLPFIDTCFDVVTAFNSLQYAGSFENALAEAVRVVKRHGKVVIGMWGKMENSDSAHIHGAITSLVPGTKGQSPAPFLLSEDGIMEGLLAAAGLRAIQKQAVLCPLTFNSDEELVQGFLSTAPCVRAVEAVGAAAVEHIILQTAQPFSVADGVYYLKNHFNLFIAQKS